VNKGIKTLRARTLEDERLWRIEITNRLTWCRLKEAYGIVRANSIMAGRDKAANLDLAKWRALGQGK